eukprot:CAMPEP_0175057022 /NCGR_PEP_ID=MMETSP0052_2-20121109/11018_1 /TAXON_ID=51329 ORGANISM="Polytomella parva, Strain SAG 63-3" /NCGR_SAMPLE_ID=MMETSP0052_2 /ASSEMBLY_ACC=CAM_ASM_000194 /LENGTH=500 /DNA_ID=CAMNT_0016322159 /DNA_START=173 /DNA_END=1675 /DNA_ORIENTATION=-
MAAESESKTEAPTDNSMKDKETLIAEAEAAKDKANIAFKAKHYQAAINGYTEAINLNPTNPIYYGNRSFAHIKLENYGVALADADKATELDPKYIKGYYRRGDAHFAMGKYKLALKDLRTAAKVAPNDPDLRKKLAECEKEVKRLRFEEALAGPATATVTSTINISDMTVEDSYTGPRMEGSDSEGYRITEKFVLDMIEAFRDQKKIHRRFAFEIILQTQNILKALPSLVDVVIPDDRHFTVCGDVHGQFYDLLNIFKLNENPSKDNPYLFNGDFVDRGSFSVEVILTLFAWKVMDPSCMHLTRGNHESKSMNMIYGFEGEVKAKYSGVMAEVFRETFCWLPLAYCLNGRVLVLHGGLFSKDDVTLDDIRKCDRNMEPPEAGLMCEALWSDPCDAPGLSMSKRGVGTQFGSDITKDFLDRNGLDLVVRSHEVKEEGYEVAHDGRLVTVFSAPNYCDQMGNRGAFVRFEGKDMKPQFTKFSAVPHPNVKPMAFASGMFRGM